MRFSQDINVCESGAEFFESLPSAPIVSGNGKKGAVIDYTCTFDIETTNSNTDGFAYSFQTCIDGVVVVQLNVHFLGANALGAVVIGHFYLSFSDSPHRS